MIKKKAFRLYSNVSFNRRVENNFSFLDAVNSQEYSKQKSQSNKWQKKRVKRINEFIQNNPEVAEYIKSKLKTN